MSGGIEMSAHLIDALVAHALDCLPSDVCGVFSRDALERARGDRPTAVKVQAVRRDEPRADQSTSR